MPKKVYEPGQRTIDLLEKLLAVQLHALGTSQDQIARIVGKRTLWVNETLRGMSRKKGGS